MVRSRGRQIVIGHLYPKQMNVYGDMGNIITLRYRLTTRGFSVRYAAIDSLKDLAKIGPDIIIGGGGQDANQALVQEDLLAFEKELKALCEDGVVGLMICGMYQMLGHRFVLPDDTQIKGVGIFDIETVAGEDRLIGNIVVDSQFGKLVGFENHSGKTYLGAHTTSLGKVLKGAGNNGEDGLEGVIDGNIFGTYLHGPALAKNPIFADELISRALARKGYTQDLLPLDDTLELRAAKIAEKRPR